MVTRHISLDEVHVGMIKPYLDAHNGNFGIALKDVINEAVKYSSRINSSAIDMSLLNWMITEIDGTLVPDGVLDEIIDPMLINSMKNLEDNLKRRLEELEWGITLDLTYDSERFPSEVGVEISGDNHKTMLLGHLISQYLVKNSQTSLCAFFGGMDEIKKVIKGRPAFWKGLINRHLASNYNMVTLHRNYLEDLFADKIPAGEIMIETLAKKPIQEIPLKEMLPLIKHVYETSRVVDRVDIDKDTIIISHSYRTREATEKLKRSILNLLETNGHLYYAKSAANTIVLTHRPDVGVKINEVVCNLKSSNNRVDQELLMFMAFLEGLKDFPDIPVSLTTLGRRIGKTLMQEYEKENNIKTWDLENFQKALQIIDSKIHRESEWKLDGKNLLLYTIRKCHIVSEGDTFDTYVCHTAREVFKGALGYAFGNRAELNINKLLTHGDNFCEVVIRIP